MELPSGLINLAHKGTVERQVASEIEGTKGNMNRQQTCQANFSILSIGLATRTRISDHASLHLLKSANKYWQQYDLTIDSASRSFPAFIRMSTMQP